MRIAYCFSGHLRTFKENRTLMKHLIAMQPGDIYVHTYSVKNVPPGMPMWHNDRARHNERVGLEDEAWIRAHYPNVKAFIVDSAEGGAFYMPNGCNAMGYRHSLACAQSLRRVAGRDNAYDLVFAARFDLVLHEPLVLPEPKPGIVYGGLNLNQQEQGLDGEVFTYGRPEVMDAMYSPMIPEGAEKDIPDFGLVGEALFTAIRLSLGLKYEAHKTKYGLLRSNGILDVRT